MVFLAWGIFGSVARGEQREGSDVDICVEIERPSIFTLVHIKGNHSIFRLDISC